MNYKVGDEVVCIDAIFKDTDEVWVYAGGTYLVNSLNFTCVSLFGITARLNEYENYVPCSDCGETVHENPHLHFDPWRFVKLPKAQVDREVQETLALVTNE